MTIQRATNFAAALSLALFAACGSSSSEMNKGTDVASDPVSPAVTAPDNAWVAITGTVTESDAHGFILDFGDGTIMVEMDDWDWFPEGQSLVDQDKVIVYGYIDDDFFERRTIEASSVYVKNLGTQFYASGVDEENFHTLAVVDFTPRIELTGTVESVAGREFKLDTGVSTIDVNTLTLGYNPLDDEGFQRLGLGDRVRVTGELGYDLFHDMDLMADSVVTVRDASKSQDS